MMTKLISWFTGLDTTGKAIMALVGVGLLVIAGITALHVVDALTETAEQKGAVTERAEAQADTIKNVEKANEARTDVRDPRSRAAYDECMRSARNPANCERFLPQ